MREAELYERLTEIFREVFADPGIRLEPRLTALDIQGWDSFRQVDIILAIEEAYGVKFRARELDGLGSVGDLARAVLEKVSAR